jgi:hypothetical protein
MGKKKKPPHEEVLPEEAKAFNDICSVKVTVFFMPQR